MRDREGNQAEKEEEKEKEGLLERCKTIKVSDMLAKKECSNDTLIQQQIQNNHTLIQQQIQNNQELYTTLSRSLLELHNDMRQFRTKSEGLDKVLFSMQQGMNKVFADINSRFSNLEKGLDELTKRWNEAVSVVEGSNAADTEGKESKEGNGEDLRKKEG